MSRRRSTAPVLRTWARRVGAAGLPFLGLACAELSHPDPLPVLPPIAREADPAPPKPPIPPKEEAPAKATISPPAVAAAPKRKPDGGIVRVKAEQPVELIAPPKGAPVIPPTATEVAPPPQVGEAPPAPAAPLPITLDAVLRLAEEQNPNVAVARERVCQAYAEQDVAKQKWLPDLYVGTAYYRHEGGIQLQEGDLIHSSTGAGFGGAEVNARLDLKAYAFQKLDAARKTLQQKGELRRITTENLLDAATTYVDFLSAVSGIAVVQELDADLEQLLTRVRKLAEASPGRGLDVLILQMEAERNSQAQARARLRASADAASAKLVYLLGLDPATCLQPVDAQIVPLNLVAATLPCPELVELALHNGPGVQELEGLLGLIQAGLGKAQGAGKFVPVVQVQMAEGLFGAGPGATASFDNRWDLALQVRWNLTDLLTAETKKRVASSQYCQVNLTYKELRARLALEVQEARESILSGADELRLSEAQIEQARKLRELTQLRLDQLAGGDFNEVLQSARGIAEARRNYLQLIRDYNKAQLRLLLLLGGSGKAPPCAPPPPPGP
jgi:outer membrane protein TolC